MNTHLCFQLIKQTFFYIFGTFGMKKKSLYYTLNTAQLSKNMSESVLIVLLNNKLPSNLDSPFPCHVEVKMQCIPLATRWQQRLTRENPPHAGTTARKFFKRMMIFPLRPRENSFSSTPACARETIEGPPTPSLFSILNRSLLRGVVITRRTDRSRQT